MGVSSYQLDERNRGFSYLGENTLDMRMDKTQELTARDVVNNYPEEKLANIMGASYFHVDKLSEDSLLHIWRTTTED